MIADDEDEMFVRLCILSDPNLLSPEIPSVEASRRMVKNYDFVISSGGIGPTHDGRRSRTWDTVIEI